MEKTSGIRGNDKGRNDKASNSRGMASAKEENKVKNKKHDETRWKRFIDYSKENIVVFDGAMGTSIQRYMSKGIITKMDFVLDGKMREGCNEVLVISKPDVIKDIHKSFLNAGAVCLETDTFGANLIKLKEYGIDRWHDKINMNAAKVAKKAIKEHRKEEGKEGDKEEGKYRNNSKKESKPLFVFGSIGPTGKLPSLMHDASFDELEDVFFRQAKALIRGGCDGLIIETSQDILEVKAAILGSKRAMGKLGIRVALIVQVTMDESEKMLEGTGMDSVLAIVSQFEPDVIGMNCSTGPKEMKEPLRYLSENYDGLISCIPNAGIPESGNSQGDDVAIYPLDADKFAREMSNVMRNTRLRIIGGCCGTTPEHIAKISGLAGISKEGDGKDDNTIMDHRKYSIARGRDRNNKKDKDHRKKTIEKVVYHRKSSGGIVSSLTESVRLKQENPPLLIGEKTNATGSRKFKQYLIDEDFNSALNIAKEQVSFGGKIIDLSCAHNDLPKDEWYYVKNMAELITTKMTAPIMLDSTDVYVIENFLKSYPGKPIINSINLGGYGQYDDKNNDAKENNRNKAGKQKIPRIRKVLELVKRYGGSVVALAIDDDGMAKTKRKKIKIADKIYRIFTNDYGLDERDLIFDFLTFPLTTGDDGLRGSAIETFEAIRELKKRYPNVNTLLGVSNCSFGINAKARSILNSAFLYHAVQYGLDIAIVNPQHILAYSDLTKKEKELCENLIFNKKRDALDDFISYFDKKEEKVIVKIKKEDMSIEEKIRDMILHRDDSHIFELLNISLKKYKAVEIINDILIPAMKEVGDLFGEGKLILPFVLDSAGIMKKAVSYLEEYMDKKDTYTKGDIIVATVYGDVHDIGKNLLKTILTNNGFNVIDLGKQVPVNVIVDEAAKSNASAICLSALLVSTSKQMEYVAEELDNRGLEIPLIVGGAAINSNFAMRISRVNGHRYKGGVYYANDAFDGLSILNSLVKGERPKQVKIKIVKEKKEKASGKKSSVKIGKIPKAPFYGTRVIENISYKRIFENMNKDYVFKLHWGIRGKNKEEQETLMKEFREVFDGLRREIIREKYFEPKILYGYFRCYSKGNKLNVIKDDDIIGFDFPRQNKKPYLCLADYFSDKEDVIAFHVTTVGNRIFDVMQALNDRGEYKKALFLHGIAVEAAEALAEISHDNIRKELGIKKGQRYSFGYPACPDLSMQKKLWKILEPKKIGVELTESNLMAPEASTSALIVHHKDAEYFNV